MRFKPSALNQFYKQWGQWLSDSSIDHELRPIHQSNPQPFSIEELQSIIGSCDDILEPNLNLSYATGQGAPQLRSAITTLYQHHNIDNIATFAGAQEAIFCCMNALLERGDKLVAITPIFEPLINPARDLDCKIETISLHAGSVWQLDLNELEDTIKKGAKLLLLNFPHNPTGAMISEEQLLQIIQICDQNNCWIFSDEVFRGLEHNAENRLPSVADLYPKSISVSVLSKAFAMPAIRLAWLNCQDQKMVKRCLQIKDYLSICNSLIDERLATKVIAKHEEIFSRNRQLINRNLVALKTIIPKINPSLEFIPPTAGCIGFPMIHNQLVAKDFAEQLIKEKGLMILPGNLFLTDLNGFRLGFGYTENINLLQNLSNQNSVSAENFKCYSLQNVPKI